MEISTGSSVRPLDRARAYAPLPEVPQQPPAGSLVLIDTFQDTFVSAAHGNEAAYAARQQGFQGPIYGEQASRDDFQSTSALMGMALQPQEPGRVRQLLQDDSRFTHLEVLEGATANLNELTESGLHDSAVNLSRGFTPQRVVEELLPRLGAGLDPRSQHFQFSQNVLGAFDLDRSKLLSPDLAIAGPERLRLFESLLQTSEAGVQSADVQQAQHEYDQAVEALQGQHNSVVVSAGNEGDLIPHLADMAGGRQPAVGKDSNLNVLVNSDVVSVGATRWFEGRNGLHEQIAGYSNLHSEVDIYASGSVATGLDENQANLWGTSFSAPRVSAALATLHGTHPGSSSDQMLNLMQNRLTHPLEDVSVLDFEETERYLREHTF